MQPRDRIPEKKNKSRVIIGGMLVVVALGGVISFLTSGPVEVKRAAPAPQIVTITLPPPPPPPPPPPKVEPPPVDEPPPEEEMVMQEPVADDEPPPEEASPPEAPPAELSTGIAGNGPDMGLSRGGGGNGRIGGGGRKGGGSRWGYYAAKVQTTIADALRRNPATRSAAFSMQVRVWADPAGRIRRAELIGSSGNPAVDDAIRRDVLSGLRLPEAPPAGMPMPITLRLTARKS